MSYDPNNPFAKILRKEIPCIPLYEDDATLAIMDIMPQADGHVLVLTKEPAATLPEMSPEGAARCIRTVHALLPAICRAVGVESVVVSQFNGAAAGQSVPHVHFHIIPRAPGVALRRHAAQPENPQTLADLAVRIRAELDRG
ncbi:MAG: HIT domain-containing protein [Rhodocyclaceae bacterium]|nr:HIT domain-containing protein [Rhodocyclaceae bacterium]MBX3668152.1 HIT domain-containing protein [Rhodocyclaceae bacterium]